MTYDELNGEQKLELKQRILMEQRNASSGEGISYGELALADDLVSDEDARGWAEGMEFSHDDFTCSATKVFRVRVTWPVSKVFQVLGANEQEALANMRRSIDAGNVSCWDPGWEADDGDDVPKLEIEKED